MITYKVEIDNDGTRHWYISKKLSRLDGPAVEWKTGAKSWYVDGKRHRLDGPAYEGCNGYKAWFIDNIQLTETEFNNRTKKTSCAGKVVEVDGVKYKLVEA